MKNLIFNNKLTIVLFTALILVGTVDATNPGHSLVALAAPLLLMSASFVFGLYRFRIRSLDSLIPIILNAAVLALTLNTKIYILNTFLLSMLVWSLLTPFAAKFRATLPASVILTVFLSFIIPYYSLPYPLLPLLYFPAYLFGYLLESLNIKNSKRTAVYCLLGALISIGLLANTFLRALKIKTLYGKVFIQGIFADKAAFVYAPIIVIGFLLLVFSVLIFAAGAIDFTGFKNRNRMDWRAAFIAASIAAAMLPPLGSILSNAHAGRSLRLLLIAVPAILFIFAYRLALLVLARSNAFSGTKFACAADIRKEQASVELPCNADAETAGFATEIFKSAADENSAAEEALVPVREVDINKILFSILFSICYVLAAVISIEFVIRGNDMTLTRYYTSTPSFAFNLIFVGILYMLAASLTGQKLGTVIFTIVHTVLLLANYLKLTFFSEPFFPWDVGLIGDAIAISRDYVSVYVIAIAAVLLSALLVLVVKNFRSVLRFLKPRPNIVLAAVMAIPLVFVLNLLGHGGLKQINIFKGWYDGVNEFIKNGTYVENVLYLQNIKNYVNSKPEGYSAEAVRQLAKKYEAMDAQGGQSEPQASDAGSRAASLANGERNDRGAMPAKGDGGQDAQQAAGPSAAGIDKEQAAGPSAAGNNKPDIIVILGETYWDPENLNGVSFNKEVAPNLKKYRSGTMVSPAFGGGTANVEFEMLTGFSNFFFNQSIIPYNVYFKRSMPSIASVFRDNGYNTVAVHPNDGNFYNRANVYKYIGFDRFEDIKAFDTASDIKGNYVSDDALVTRIEDILKENDAPVFIQGITMQNHDPFTGDIKNYGAGREIQAKSDRLNEKELDILSNFAQGVYDEDKALGRLIEIAQRNDRPTIICFYGDHLPRLGVGLPQGNYEIYNKLGYNDGKLDPRTDIRFFETPYILWSNYKELPKLDSPVSPSQLAVELLRGSDVKYPSYFNSLLELRKTHPYLSSYLDSKAALADDEAVREYYMVQYDIMFGKRYILQK